MFVGKDEFVDWENCLKSSKIHWERLIKKANDFATCAVGHQTSALPRKVSGYPANKSLVNLGFDFLSACENKNAKEALEIFNKISKVAKIESKKFISQFKKLAKKSKEIQERFEAGEREFAVAIDKNEDIYSLRESDYTMVIPDDVFS